MIALAQEIGQIYTRIAEPIGRSAPELIDGLADRCAWLARSAEILADAQEALDCERGRVAEEIHGQYTATVMREIMGERVAPVSKLVNQADRLNATLTHQIDAIRTLLSYEKQSLQNERLSSGR